MKAIWKYPLEIRDLQTLMVPEGATILTVQAQHDIPVLWALVDPKAPKVRRDFEILGTGNPVEEGERNYIATIQTHGGQLVWHVFEQP